MKKVAVAAAAPITSMRTPPRIAPRPVNKLMLVPTPNNAAAVTAIEPNSAGRPTPIRNGTSGTKAPSANDANEEMDAPQGEPSSPGSSPNSSRASVSSA